MDANSHRLTPSMPPPKSKGTLNSCAEVIFKICWCLVGHIILIFPYNIEEQERENVMVACNLQTSKVIKK